MKLIFILLFLLAQISLCAQNDTIQLFYTKTSSDFGGTNRGITVFVRDTGIYVRMVEYNHTYSARQDNKWILLHYYHDGNKDFLTIVEDKRISNSQFYDFLRILEEIKAHIPEEGISTNHYHYVIKDRDGTHIVVDLGKYRKGDEIEHILGLDKIFYMRFNLSEKPALYALDGIKMPYEKIKSLISNDNVPDGARFDRNYSDANYWGLFYVYTNLLVIYDNKLLYRKKDKQRYLSDLDYNKLEFIKLDNVESEKLYGKKGKNGTLIINSM